LIALHKAEFCFHFKARTAVATTTFLGIFLKLETFWLLLKIRYAVFAFKVDLMDTSYCFQNKQQQDGEKNEKETSAMQKQREQPEKKDFGWCTLFCSCRNG
jgi:hypothetical protein